MFNLNFLSSEFACFVAGEIIQVIEAMPGSVVPMAMFSFTCGCTDNFCVANEPNARMLGPFF